MYCGICNKNAEGCHSDFIACFASAQISFFSQFELSLNTVYANSAVGKVSNTTTERLQGFDNDKTS